MTVILIIVGILVLVWLLDKLGDIFSYIIGAVLLILLIVGIVKLFKWIFSLPHIGAIILTIVISAAVLFVLFLLASYYMKKKEEERKQKLFRSFCAWITEVGIGYTNDAPGNDEIWNKAVQEKYAVQIAPDCFVSPDAYEAFKEKFHQLGIAVASDYERELPEFETENPYPKGKNVVANRLLQYFANAGEAEVTKGNDGKPIYESTRSAINGMKGDAESEVVYM